MERKEGQFYRGGIEHRPDAIKMGQDVRTVEEGVTSGNTFLEDLSVGNGIGYKGETFVIEELPSETNQNKYRIATRDHKIVYRLTSEQLIKILTEEENEEPVAPKVEKPIETRPEPTLETWTEQDEIEERELKIILIAMEAEERKQARIKKTEQEEQARKERARLIAEAVPGHQAEKLVREDEVKEKMPKIQTFSTDFMKQRVESLLGSEKMIKEVKSVEVTGKGNKISLSIKVMAEKGVTVNVGVTAVLENKKGSIAVKNYKIDANWMVKGTVENIIAPKLNEVSKILKAYIEKEDEEKREVSKMEIVDGELKVTFK